MIEDLLATISIIPLDSRIARLTALVRRHYRVKVPDSIIAATAMHHGLTVVTRDRSDFDKAGVPVINPWDAT